MPPGLGQSQEIANGFATTETDGTFQVAFVPRPDRSVPESDQPTFEYLITADVTDGTGETRTASKSISVGYTALELDASAKDWQTTSEPVAMELSTTTLDGKGLTAKGKITLYRLIEPTSVSAHLIPCFQDAPWELGRGN
jgi:cbb3-type cytochrome oxidase cytochrome c subunit